MENAAESGMTAMFVWPSRNKLFAPKTDWLAPPLQAHARRRKESTLGSRGGRNGLFGFLCGVRCNHQFFVGADDEDAHTRPLG